MAVQAVLSRSHSSKVLLTQTRTVTLPSLVRGWDGRSDVPPHPPPPRGSKWPDPPSRPSGWERDLLLKLGGWRPSGAGEAGAGGEEPEGEQGGSGAAPSLPQEWG